MSNSRHPDIENGTVGRILRRMTLATLGLDAMDGVSEQSFDVIDKADSFAERLMGGMSSVLPKIHTEYMESRATGLVDHILTGMTGLNGPKSATDLGDWQYWLDAALLMLFDEEEDEDEAVYASAGKVAHAAKNTQQVRSAAMQQALRERVVALKNSGIKPSMLQALSNDQKRAVISQLKAARKATAEHTSEASKFAGQKDADSRIAAELSNNINVNGAQQFADSIKASLFGDSQAESALFASTLLNVVKEASNHRSIDTAASKIERIYGQNAQNSHQTFVSHIADKAASVSASLNDAKQIGVPAEHRAEAMRLAENWTEAVAGLNASGKVETASVRRMLTTIDALERIGAVTREQAHEIRNAGQSYARHILAEEVSRDITTIAGRIEQMVGRVSDVAGTEMVSHRAVTYTGNTPNVEAIQILRNSVAAISDKLGSLSETVASKVLSDGETAATMRWQRAAERFTRMQGISDDVDRVLLRDIIESAEALGSTGVVSADMVKSIVSIPAQIQSQNQTPAAVSSIAAAQSSNVSASQSRSVQTILNGREADKYIQNSAIQMLSRISSRVEASVNTLADEITASGILRPQQAESFVSDIRRIAAQGKTAAATDSLSVIETSSIIESLSEKLDQFAQFTARNVVEQGYDELTGETPAFVSTSETAAQSENVSASAAMNAAAVSSVRELQVALQKAQQTAQAQIRSFVETQQASAKQAESRKFFEALASANTVEAMVKAQNALSAHLSAEQQSQLKQTIEAVRSSEAHLENVSRQIRMIENAVKLSGDLKNVLNSGIHTTAQTLANRPQTGSVISAPVMLSDVRVNGDYLASLGQTLASYARIRNEFAKVQSGSTSLLSGMDVSRLDKMLSIVSPVSSRNVAQDQRLSGFAGIQAAASMDTLRKIHGRTDHQNLSISAADADLVKQYAAIGNLDMVYQIANEAGHSASSVSDSTELTGNTELTRLFNTLSAQPELARRIAEMAATGKSTQAGVLQNNRIAEFLDSISSSNPETVVGYDEIIPETASFVSQQSARGLYPSNDNYSDLTSILGSRKAIELHASEMATGRPGSAQTLGQAIERWAASAHGNDSFVSYGISENGERVKVTLGLTQSSGNGGYQLRQNMGSSYMPVSSRQTVSSPVAASLNIDKISSAQTISGAEEFMPVIAGANQTYSASDASTDRILTSLVASLAGNQNISQTLSVEGNTLTAAQQAMVQSAVQAQNAQNTQNASSSDSAASQREAAMQNILNPRTHQSQAQANAQAIADRNTISGILGRLGIQINANRMPETSERLQLNVGNVDFDMTSADFVNMVAKPAISSTSFMAPTLVNANNVMFSGYASLMNSQGERRSLKSLRKSYVEAMAKSGARSTHAEIGFNTQSFANILGLTSGSIASDNRYRMVNGGYDADSSHAFVSSASIDASASSTASASAPEARIAAQGQMAGQTEETLAQSIIDGHAPVASTEYGSSVDFSWISNQLMPQFNAGSNAASESQTVEKERQILGRIDNMLDYVENMSSRNVGVFSSNDTVRVLLESMSTEGELGNKGLPKWRQKDTKAARAAQARELREALAKIGANPIQGTQRVNDRNYVSPNLFANQNQAAAPLFSGGGENGSGSVPTAASHASGNTNNRLDNSTIPEDDLQFIAEEIYNKIVDSLNDELKRRRTE